jgi:hypothetical protein
MTELAQLKTEFISFITHLFTRGTSAFIIILGRRETGKTDFALLIAEILYDKGIIKHIATNIKIKSAPFPISHISNLDDLRYWAENTRGKKLFLFDEFGKAMRRRTPMSSLNVKLIDDFQVLRKFKQSTIAITVNEKYIDNVALGSDILDGYFIKPNYKNQKVAYYYDCLENYGKSINGIPGTSIDFDTWDVARFKEHGVKAKPQFKDHDLEVLWDWSHGMTYKDLKVHPQKINRLTRKIVKELLERQLHTSP